MIAYYEGKYTVKRDGTPYYKVYDGRKLIGKFLNLGECIGYIKLKKDLQQ